MSERRCEVAGQRLLLRADRTMHWARAKTLLLADPHFGKDAVFRKQGVGLPAGVTRDDLARLSRALSETGCERLVILGDFWHAPPAGDEAWLAEFGAWRRRHTDLEIIVTRGNHDRGADLPAEWAIEWRCEPLPAPPFIFRHEPEAALGGYVLAGHLHPVIHLRSAGERLRPPVFWFTGEYGVLPAFGSFTGGLPVKPRVGHRVFAVGPDQVTEIGISART